MAEAFGTMLIKAPAEVVGKMVGDDEGISWDCMSMLFLVAGISSLKASHYLLEFGEGEHFYHEGIEERDGFVMITIFGEEWMHAMQPLVMKGKGIQVYGRIDHEHGYTEYYALNDNGERFCEGIDFEGDEEFDEQAVVDKWLLYVPGAVREKFHEVFEDDNDQCDYDDE